MCAKRRNLFIFCLLWTLQSKSCFGQNSEDFDLLGIDDNVILNTGYKMPLRGFGTFHWKAWGPANKHRTETAVYEALKAGYR